MTKTVLLVLAMALVPACSFAVDGVVLINQSTVMAAGGFPYIIKDPGSYKLSGNLTMSTTTTGNYSGLDIAIGINSSGVVLDLNGFSIIVNNNNQTILHNFYAIADLGSYRQTSIKNGTITVNSVATITGVARYGIYLHSSLRSSVEDLSVYVDSSCFVSCGPRTVDLGQESLILRNVLSGSGPNISCPSVVVQNVGIGSLPISCVSANNL